MATATLTLDTLNQASLQAFVEMLQGIYEHSPWIAAEAWARKPADGFSSLDQLKHALAQVVRTASQDAQLALIRAHPDLAGRLGKALTKESQSEQKGAGLDQCTPEEFQRLQNLNASAPYVWNMLSG